MRLSYFLKDKIFFLSIQFFIIFFIWIILSVFNVDYKLIFLICSFLIILNIISITIEYLKKQFYFKEVYKNLENLDKKYYIYNLIEEPNFEEGYAFYNIIKKMSKVMSDEVTNYKIANEDYRQYIETWIHEIKLPIACISLICENNKNNINKSILDELDRIENFIEVALYYARSTNLENDYTIRSINLNELIKNYIKNHSKQLINCKCSISLENLDYIVYSDTKWLEFIIGQIVANSIKYKKNNFKLKFFVEETEKNLILNIEDNGIGIPKKDIQRIFEKGFTGENGRKYKKATGIGLYLCKILCDKMYLNIDAISNENIGTTIRIIFPKDKSIFFND